MRLTSFSLENYAHFAAVRLSLDPHPGRINLVVAPNGGGKTVLRQAFHDLLFGIRGQTKMAFQFGYPGMRLIAEGIDGNGVPFAIGRRKGIGNTLFDGEGNSLDPAILKQLIGEADGVLFERLFALDSELLRSGANAMLASGGDLAEALFAAGSGVAGLRRLRDQYEGSRDQLAPGHRVGSRPFYRELDAFHGAVAAVRAATIQPRDWEESSTKLTFARDRRDSLATRQARDQARIEQLERIKRVQPWLEQWCAAQQEVEHTSGAPRLPSDTERRWRDARRAVEIAEREHKAATDRLQSILEALAAERLDCGLLVEGERIDDIERARDQIASDHRDLPRRETEQRQASARLAELLSALGAGSADEITAIPPNGPQVATARELITQHGALAERLRSAEADAAKCESEIAAAKDALGQIGESDDAADLEARVEEAHADGDPVRRLIDLQAKLALDQARLVAALAKVPLWDRGVEALAAVVPPSRQGMNRAATAVEKARATQVDVEREVERLSSELSAAAERLAREREGKPVPDVAAIEAVRAHRDLGWSLIRRSKFEGKALESEIAAYAMPLGLATVFERAIGAADDLADRRDEESRRLAAIAEQELIIARLNKEIGTAGQGVVEARDACKDAAHRWAAVAGAFGFAEIPDPGDLREVIAAREAVLEARMQRDVAQQAVEAEAERQEAARDRLARLLPPEKCASLAEALSTAQQVIDRCAEARQERDRVRAEIETFRRLHRQAFDERNLAEQAFATWQSEWRECLSRLNRPPTETPAGVGKSIELIEEAHLERRKLADLDHRVAGMRQNIAEFEMRVADLVAAVTPDLIGQSAEAAAGELRKRLKDNRETEARRDILLAQEMNARAKLGESVTEHECGKAVLEALQQEIGASAAEEIASRITLARRRSDAEAKLIEIEARLVEIGDGWPIEALEREIEGVPAENLDTELEQLRLDAERLSKDREDAARDEERILAERQRIEAGDNAIDAEERRQAAIASIARISAEALLDHAAGCLLRQGIERLREAGDSDLVRRVGAAFARITGGAYAGIAADEDENGAPFLTAIEADRTTTKRIEQLSDGTRDQLFLALRLVMIEDYAEKAPALPFIADDLLQTFDDYGRTANALAALSDLSSHVQVIVLSHHRQLIDVVRALPVGTVNVCELAA